MSRKRSRPVRQRAPNAKARERIERMLAQGLQFQRVGDALRARQSFESVLRMDPRNADGLHLLGLLEAQAGRIAEAAVLMQRAVAANPKVSFYHYNLGNALYRLGRHEEAAQAFEQTLRLQPGIPEALCNLGNALSAQGRHAEAIPQFEKAIGLRPDYADAHNNLGSALLANGDAEGAVAAYRRAIRLAPQSFAARSGLGNALMALTRFEEAIVELRRALELQPRRAEAMLSLGKALLLNDERQEALRWLTAARDAPEADAAACINAGDLFSRIGQHAEAEAAYRRVLAKDPEDLNLRLSLAAARARQGAYDEAEGELREVLAKDSSHPEALLWLGNVYMHLGHFDEAVRHYRRGMDLKPDAISARLGLLEARGYEVDSELVEEMRQLAETAELSGNEAARLNFTLARSLDAEDRYEEAFRHLERANQLMATEFDPAEYREDIDRIIDTFSAEFFATRAGWGSHRRMPILVLGMPRSGTTLVEQILASHPDVMAGGELAYLSELSMELADEIDKLDYPEAVAAASKAQIDALSQAYLRRLEALSKGLPRVTDKLPHNFMRLGLIGLCLPAAKVIHVRRHPLDTCLSIYFQNFERGHAYSWDLSHLGSYYREYERLMRHWRRVVPLQTLDVQYEELVANQEQKSRELLEYCGLPWDDRCLRFWETERAVDTASLWQVRQPMYARSVERWRHYEAHLGPLKEALGLEGGEGRTKD